MKSIYVAGLVRLKARMQRLEVEVGKVNGLIEELIKSFDVPAELWVDYAISIEDLGLTTRTYRALRRHNIYRVGQILIKTEKQLLDIHGLGVGGLEELRKCLEGRGLFFKSAGSEE